MTPYEADLLIRGALVHTLVPGLGPQRALAVRGERVVALSPDPTGLDAWVTEQTVVHDLPEATVLPAFDDTHSDLIFAGLSAHDVPVHRAQRIAGVRTAGGQYAATGIGTVRDCAVSLADYSVLVAAREAGALNIRIRALISALGLSTATEVEYLLDDMEDWRYSGDTWLRIRGVKFGLDGGLEAGGTEEPYASDHSFSGTMKWEPDVLAEAVEAVARRGWRVGAHTYGDRTVRILLDVYERVLAANPGLPPGTLVMEHAGLAGPEQRARAVALGIPVTAGSDFPVGQFGAMRSVWGLTTRQGVTYDEAIALHTTLAARLLGEEDLRGTLAPGRLADLTVWDQDPAGCSDDVRRDLNPSHTFLGGRLIHGPGIA